MTVVVVAAAAAAAAAVVVVVVVVVVVLALRVWDTYRVISWKPEPRKGLAFSRASPDQVRL